MSGQDPRDIINSYDFLQLFAEGRARNISNFIPTTVPRTTFKRMVVLDVVTDPHNILTGPGNEKIDYWKNVLHVSNYQFSNILPRNTIIGVFAHSETNPMFVFPFFPSHMSLPCKPGETVWVMVEDPNIAQLEIAYWFCKITEPHYVDDVNHQHSPRLYDASFAPPSVTSKRDRSQNDGRTSPIYELRNGATKIIEGTRVTLTNTSLIKITDKEDIFERLILTSDGSHLIAYESVPRFKKRPADLAFEGSNNTLVVLGTDRHSYAATFEIGDNGAKQFFPMHDFVEDAGSIDLVAGRGQFGRTGGIEVATTSINNSSIQKSSITLKKELAKGAEQISNEEGDFDLYNDRSRIQISQRTNVDQKFGIEDYNLTEFEIEDSKDNEGNLIGDATIVIKTDKIRLIARSDIQILVTGFTEAKNTKGRDIKVENIASDDADLDESDNFSSIVIRANGDIIIKPAQKGMIKLGDDTADRALLCTDLPASLIELPDSTSVSALTAPLSNTMGGRFGGTGILTQGTWASKVLVTGAK